MENNLNYQISKYIELLKEVDFAGKCLPSDLGSYFGPPHEDRGSLGELDFSKLQAQLTGPVAYYLGQPSKFMRTLITLVIGSLFEIGETDKLLSIASAVEVFHNASMVIDDIEDKADTRREQPSAHKKFGVDSSINSACFCYFLGIDKLIKELGAFANSEQQLKIYRTITDMFIKGHIGNAFDLRTHGHVDESETFKVEEFESFLMLKTSALMLLIIDLIEILFKVDLNAYRLIRQILGHFCLGFQIMNDIVSLDPRNPKFGDDLVERKVSHPMIIFLDKEKDPVKRSRFFGIVNSPCISSEQLLEARELLAHSIDSSLQCVLDTEAKMRRIITEELTGLKNADLLLQLFSYIKLKMFPTGSVAIK
jgi:geranylgeranyl pyrophosphate synthase